MYCLHCIDRTHPIVSMVVNWAMQDIKLRINDLFHIFDWNRVFLAVLYVTHNDSKKLLYLIEDSKTENIIICLLIKVLIILKIASDSYFTYPVHLINDPQITILHEWSNIKITQNVWFPAFIYLWMNFSISSYVIHDAITRYNVTCKSFVI